jgi:biopolymer transport protein ExbD
MTLQHVSWQCECRPGIRDLDLPVADMGEGDKGQEEDDRLFLQLDPTGRVYCHRALSRPPEALSLEAVAGVLREARERYDLKMRQQGKSGFEDPRYGNLSRLYVLIRADRAAAASHVGWALHALAREGFYKVQFAVRREPGEDPGPCMGRLSGKLQVFLPTDNLPGIVSKCEPALHVYVDREAYGLGPTRGMDLEKLGRLAREEYERVRADEGRTIVAAVHVAPGVAWGRVVAAINTLARAGIEKVDFHGLPPPDEATRLMIPLPR